MYFKTHFATPVTSFVLKFYPILQERLLTIPTIRTIVIVNNLGYYITVADPLPGILVDDAFLINAYDVVAVLTSTTVKFNLIVTYAMSISISRPIYVQID